MNESTSTVSGSAGAASGQHALPIVIFDRELPAAVTDPLAGKVRWQRWPSSDGPPQQVDGIFTYGHPNVDRELLARLPGVRVISNFGVGVDHIDLDAASERSIPVGHTPGVLDAATADMGMALLLACARQLVVADRYARSERFTGPPPGWLLGTDLSNQTVGIVGMGRIGQQVARRCLGFGMRVCYHNRRPLEALPDGIQATYVAWDCLLTESDFIVLCVPLTAGTMGLVGAAELARMKSTAILVNIARGAVVDTDALTVALQRRQIRAAGLDVTEPEPLPRDHPLLVCDNLVIAPHLGSAAEQTRQAMARLAVENLLRGLAGQSLLHTANGVGSREIGL